MAGAIAVAALAFAPAATADLNKCVKELSKNGGKGAADVQKEMEKCADGWQKELDKLASNLAGGKSLAGGAAKNLNKQAEKCQKSLAKIFGDPSKTLTLPADITADTKSKLGKLYQKIQDASSKGKCTAQELQSAGFPGDFPLTGRLLAASAVNAGWNNAQVFSNSNSVSALDEASQKRCDATGVACSTLLDCPNGGGDSTCGNSKCPDCRIFGRQDESQPATNATPAGLGSYAGPCASMQCSVSAASINLDTAGLGPVSATLGGDLNFGVCDLPTVLPNAWAVTGGASRGNLAIVASFLPVCVDNTRVAGWIAKNASSPNVPDTAGCADHNTATVNDCNGFSNCTSGTDTFGNPTQTCLDQVPSGPPAAGDTLVSLSQRLSIVLGAVGADGTECTPDDGFAPGTVANTVLTTKSAFADVFDAGTGGTFGAGTLSVGPVVGNPLDAFCSGPADRCIDSGYLSNGIIVGAFATVTDDPASPIGDSATEVQVTCAP